MRCGNQPHNAGEGGLLADCRDADAKASAAGHGSRDHRSARHLRYGLRLARDHRLVNIGSALDDYAIRWDASSGPDKDNVAHVQFPQWNGLNFRAVYTLGSVWEQSGECIERATSLRNGSHFEPVAKNHNRNQRCEFHQTSISNRPSVAASEVAKATMMARLMSVIMPGLRSASSACAPRTKTRPP